MQYKMYFPAFYRFCNHGLVCLQVGILYILSCRGLYCNRLIMCVSKYHGANHPKWQKCKFLCKKKNCFYKSVKCQFHFPWLLTFWFSRWLLQAWKLVTQNSTTFPWPQELCQKMCSFLNMSAQVVNGTKCATFETTCYTNFSLNINSYNIKIMYQRLHHDEWEENCYTNFSNKFAEVCLQHRGYFNLA